MPQVLHRYWLFNTSNEERLCRSFLQSLHVWSSTGFGSLSRCWGLEHSQGSLQQLWQQPRKVCVLQWQRQRHQRKVGATTAFQHNARQENLNPRPPVTSQLSHLLRFEHGGFGGGGGGNSRWVEESRDDGDWSKPLPRNERLEQWVCSTALTSCGWGCVPGGNTMLLRLDM